ncbi:MAG TPA: hypothetical protein VFV87_05415 [Pirellulaceae bacterium]|nr:hypothetical protein [Pirellulaceae bacterium]
MLGHLLTSWTIRLALALYVAWLAGWLVASGPRWAAASRWIWTLACGLFLVHVACAFHFYHHWSHAAAWQDTADETQALLGVAFGDGIYFSYAFMVLWVLDVAWLWLVSPVWTPWPRLLVHAFLLFIAFNGAIVFEAGPTRWFGLAACAVLAGLAVRRAYNWQRSIRRGQKTEDRGQTAEEDRGADSVLSTEY